MRKRPQQETKPPWEAVCSEGAAGHAVGLPLPCAVTAGLVSHHMEPLLSPLAAVAPPELSHGLRHPKGLPLVLQLCPRPGLRHVRIPGRA